jgi:TPR repeat protein
MLARSVSRGIVPRPRRISKFRAALYNRATPFRESNMSIRKLLLFVIGIGALSVAFAGQDEAALFDRVERSAYTDLLRDAATAYGAERYDEAFAKFRRTACAGDKQSQSALGRMYLLGQGIQRDDLTGYSWLKMAAEFIYPKYQSVVRALEEAMTPAQRSVADTKVAALRERYSLGATGMSCTQSASQGGHIIDQIICTPRREGRRLLLRRCDSATALD